MGLKTEVRIKRQMETQPRIVALYEKKTHLSELRFEAQDPYISPGEVTAGINNVLYVVYTSSNSNPGRAITPYWLSFI